MVKRPENRGRCVPNANMTQFKLPDPWSPGPPPFIRPDHRRSPPPLSCMSRFGFIVIVIIRKCSSCNCRAEVFRPIVAALLRPWRDLFGKRDGTHRKSPGTRHAGTNDEARTTETRSSAP